MAVILELDLACGAKPDGTFAVVPAVLRVFVDCSEVGWLVLSVVEVSCKQHLVSEIQHFALSAFQIFRRGGVRQPVFLIASLSVISVFSVFLCLSSLSARSALLRT